MGARLPTTAAGADRDRLGFVPAVRARFGFLLDAGYSEAWVEPTYVRFERGNDPFVEVFHGRASYELGVEFGRVVHVDDDLVEQKFHIADVVSLFWPGEEFRAPTATAPEQIERFVAELAGWAERAFERFEVDAAEVFDRLSEMVRRRSDEYLERIRAERLRSRADESWRRQDFASVINAYEEIDADLETVQLRNSERKRLGYAREHLSDT